MTLALQGIQVAYGTRLAVDGVDLVARPGEVTGLIGPNGSGKSSLLRAIAGLVPHRGRLAFAGQGRESARIGHMPQDHAVRAALTVFEVVLLGRLRSLALGVARADLDAARTTLETLGISDLANRQIGELSGGQRQLALLAQVLAAEPTILLLDEPISALDLRHQLEVLDIVGRFTRMRALTTIVVLHDLNAAARHCDALHVLCDGRKVAGGAPEAVLTAALLADVFGIEALVERARDGRPLVVPLRACIPADSARTRPHH